MHKSLTAGVNPALDIVGPSKNACVIWILSMLVGTLWSKTLGSVSQGIKGSKWQATTSLFNRMQSSCSFQALLKRFGTIQAWSQTLQKKNNEHIYIDPFRACDPKQDYFFDVLFRIFPTSPSSHHFNQQRKHRKIMKKIPSLQMPHSGLPPLKHLMTRAQIQIVGKSAILQMATGHEWASRYPATHWMDLDGPEWTWMVNPYPKCCGVLRHQLSSKVRVLSQVDQVAHPTKSFTKRGGILLGHCLVAKVFVLEQFPTASHCKACPTHGSKLLHSRWCVKINCTWRSTNSSATWHLGFAKRPLRKRWHQRIWCTWTRCTAIHVHTTHMSPYIYKFPYACVYEISAFFQQTAVSKHVGGKHISEV